MSLPQRKVATILFPNNQKRLINADTRASTPINERIVAKRPWCSGWQVVVEIGPPEYSVYRLMGAKSLEDGLQDQWKENQSTIKTIADTVPSNEQYTLVGVAFKDSKSEGPDIILQGRGHKILRITPDGSDIIWCTAASMKGYLKADSILNHGIKAERTYFTWQYLMEGKGATWEECATHVLDETAGWGEEGDINDEREETPAGKQNTGSSTHGTSLPDRRGRSTTPRPSIQRFTTPRPTTPRQSTIPQTPQSTISRQLTTWQGNRRAASPYPEDFLLPGTPELYDQYTSLPYDQGLELPNAPATPGPSNQGTPWPETPGPSNQRTPRPSNQGTPSPTKRPEQMTTIPNLSVNSLKKQLGYFKYNASDRDTVPVLLDAMSGYVKNATHPELQNLSVAVLAWQLQLRKMSNKGLKEELVARLWDYLSPSSSHMDLGS